MGYEGVDCTAKFYAVVKYDVALWCTKSLRGWAHERRTEWVVQRVAFGEDTETGLKNRNMQYALGSWRGESCQCAMFWY
jgi:hypothetical protein